METSNLFLIYDFKPTYVSNLEKELLKKLFLITKHENYSVLLVSGEQVLNLIYKYICHLLSMLKMMNSELFQVRGKLNNSNLFSLEIFSNDFNFDYISFLIKCGLTEKQFVVSRFSIDDILKQYFNLRKNIF
jgi:hypothetical protein